MTKREYILVMILVLLVVLLMALIARNPLLWRAAPGSPYAGLDVQKRSPSITYEVFRPAIVSYNELVDYFRPSNLRAVGCYGSPAKLSSAAFNWLTGLCQ